MNSRRICVASIVAVVLHASIQGVWGQDRRQSETQNTWKAESPPSDEYESNEADSTIASESGLQPSSTLMNDRRSCPGNTCEFLSGSCRPRLRIYAQAEALALWRSNSARYQPFVLNNATGVTLASTDSLKFDAAPGARFVLGVANGSGRAYEASYFGLQNWKSSATVQGNNNLRIPGDIALATLDFIDADQMRVSYASDLQNAEFNRIVSDGPISTLIGFRYVHLAERFNIQATDLNTGTSDYKVRSQNDLFGGQIGLKLRENWGSWFLEAGARVGLFGNACQQRSYLGDFDNTFVLRNSRNTAGTAALVTDLNVSAVCPLTRVWALRCGFDLLFLDGIALAPDQLDFTDNPTSGLALHRNGDVLFVGGSLGVQARW